ncbi:MAG: nucleoside 2-deoxyribosyltransferase [Sebaldella sp.]|nr:nucleoside 2-deoxyribosyltransferase [Sebaldella sp.]
MKIYFAGSVRGGREKRKEFEEIISKLKEFGKVLTEHISDPEIEKFEYHQTDREIYEQDINWLRNSDVMVAEVSILSIGVGYEIGYADAMEKRVICLYDLNSEKQLSAMIRGNSKIEILEYTDINEALKRLEKLFKKGESV